GRLNGVWGLREFAVPVHVARNLTPRIKKLWWYPYDDETVRTLRGVAELFSAPSWSEKKQALRTILTNVVPAIRNKY
ncbi:MAG TPA: hypothetical protein VI541_06135, partial [Actinomycetota bacterium]|nr:hypothetical protein [Actinomycetota bacterium]